MARSSYGKVLGWGLAIGAVAGAFSLFRDKAKASTVPVGRSPSGAKPKQRFHTGDEVTVTGGPTGTDRTFIVRSATLTPTGWQYDLGEGAPMPQSALHMVTPAGEREVAPVMVKAAPIAPVAPMSFPPEVVTHSPEFLAREKAAKVAAAKAAATKASPIQGGPKMTARQQRITDLLGLVKTEKDAAKKQALAEELKKLALEEKAALVAVPSVPQPLYPVGLEAAFGKRKAKITGASRDAQGVWHYTIDLQSGEFLNLGSGIKYVTEDEIRKAIASELGPLAPGQAYPRGIAIFRGGQGGVVQSAQQGSDGTWTYQIANWPTAVAQSELQAILRRA